MSYIKGTLHNHTSVSDGDSSPRKAAEYYKKLGYDFMVFTDHKINYPVNEYVREIKDFLCISGIESEYHMNNYFNNMTDIHLCGLGFVGDYIPPKGADSISEMIDSIIDEFRRFDAVPMVNHPNWGGTRHGYSFNYTELQKVRNPFLMEIVNYSDGGYNEGNEAFESVEYI
ncbi:MAG: hypothetical protein KBT47_08570, partial [Armatimonadetes bacterium]|nr:hypothetical protein [Candidatus Hippobium faecium]